jgi:acyl transferase domain-containing protein
VIYPAPDGDDVTTSSIDQTAYTQPALFAIEYALARLWQSWGIQPAAVMGHSVGEYVAACIAGVFSLEDGLKLVAGRGRLMQALPAGGRMAAVLAPEEQVMEAVRPYADRVSIASINGPSNVVISGSSEAVGKIVRSFEERG